MKRGQQERAKVVEITRTLLGPSGCRSTGDVTESDAVFLAFLLLCY